MGYQQQVVMRKVIFFALLWLGLGFAPSTIVAASEKPLTAEVVLSPSEFSAEQVIQLQAKLNLPVGYKAYQDKFAVSIVQPEGFKISNFQIEPLEKFYDKFSKKQRQGFKNSSRLSAYVEAPKVFDGAMDSMLIRINYQACTDTYCLFPEILEINVPFKVKAQGSANNLTTETEDKKWTDLFQMNFADIFKKSLPWTFLFVFLFGILTSFTPCIFPMIPITLAVLGKDVHAHSRWQTVLVSHFYVFGIAITYAVLGLIAASTGSLFGSIMSSPLVLGVVCLVFLLMALSMFGLFEFAAPQNLQNSLGKIRLKGYSGAFLTGIIAGLVASPCVGPVLVGILTFVARSQNLWLGFCLLFVYALGLGQVFLVLGYSSRLTRKLPRSGPWMDGIKNFFAVLMLGVFFYYLALLIPGRIWDGIFGIALIALASHFGAFIHNSLLTAKTQLRKGFMLAILSIGVAYLGLAIFDLRPLIAQRWIQENPNPTQPSNWQPYSEAQLQEATKLGKPVIVDFFADWCASCKELEQYTFQDAKVQMLSEKFITLKFDATLDSPEFAKIRQKYAIVGLPTVIFYSAKGEWLKELTLSEFEDPAKFILRMNKAL